MNNHYHAIERGEVTSTNVIGLRKAINADARPWMQSRTSPKLCGAELAATLDLLREREPRVVDKHLHATGLARLRDKRYAKRLEPYRATIDAITEFRLVGFADYEGNAVPMYKACAPCGSFVFINPAWQSGGDGPEVITI